MRELSADDNPKTLSSEVYFIMKLYTINEPLLPNLTTLQLRDIGTLLVQFIPLFLSPRITSISFEFSWSRPPESMIASVITILPMSCPNLQHINIQVLSRDPMIAAAVSRMTIDIDQNALLTLHVDAPLTEEASEVVSKSQNIRSLSVVIGGGTSIPSASLPNLTRLEIKCDDGSDGLQLLRGTTFGKLESVCFDIESELIGDFLEAFKEAALSSSLLPLTRLVYLVVSFLCDDNCSVVDDDTVIDLSWAMPKLKHLQLGREPCYQFTGGVTTKGLVALAHNCPDISYLCVHFQVASLSTPTPGLETTSNIRHSVSWTGCALTDLMVGEMPIADELESMVALTLLRIFPRIETINQVCNDEWDEVQDLICRSKEIVDCSSKYHHPTMWTNSLLTLLRSQIYGR